MQQSEEERLVEDYFPLAFKLALRHKKPYELEDRLSAAGEGLVRGVRRYLKYRKFAPATYIYGSVSNSMRDARALHDRSYIGTYSPVWDDEDDERAIGLVEDPDPFAVDYVNGLPIHMREMAVLYMRGYTHTEVAKELGVNIDRVVTLRRQMRNALSSSRNNGGGK